MQAFTCNTIQGQVADSICGVTVDIAARTQPSASAQGIGNKSGAPALHRSGRKRKSKLSTHNWREIEEQCHVSEMNLLQHIVSK